MTVDTIIPIVQTIKVHIQVTIAQLLVEIGIHQVTSHREINILFYRNISFCLIIASSQRISFPHLQNVSHSFMQNCSFQMRLEECVYLILSSKAKSLQCLKRNCQLNMTKKYKVKQTKRKSRMF